MSRLIDQQRLHLEPFSLEKPSEHWDEEKQSKLIELMLMRMPLPAVYLITAYDGYYDILDGFERLTAIYNFHKDKLPLQIKARPELHEKRFSDLTPQLKNRFEDQQLTIHIIDDQLPSFALLEIFWRLNT